MWLLEDNHWAEKRAHLRLVYNSNPRRELDKAYNFFEASLSAMSAISKTIKLTLMAAWCLGKFEADLGEPYRRMIVSRDPLISPLQGRLGTWPVAVLRKEITSATVFATTLNPETLSPPTFETPPKHKPSRPPRNRRSRLGFA